MSDLTILAATTNRGKLGELRSILAGLPLRLVTLDEYPGLAEPTEDGPTFESNARLKAQYYARLTGCWTIADDSGLEVDTLGLEPGVHSARYAGPMCDDAANNAKLINRLVDVAAEDRTARFRCVVALANAEAVLATAWGTLEGVIVDEPRGAHGFGYDPHFFVPSLGMTTAEMTPAQKNAISHRGQALRALRPEIERLLVKGDVSEAKR